MNLWVESGKLKFTPRVAFESSFCILCALSSEVWSGPRLVGSNSGLGLQAVWIKKNQIIQFSQVRVRKRILVKSVPCLSPPYGPSSYGPTSLIWTQNLTVCFEEGRWFEGSQNFMLDLSHFRTLFESSPDSCTAVWLSFILLFFISLF